MARICDLALMVEPWTTVMGKEGPVDTRVTLGQLLAHSNEQSRYRIVMEWQYIFVCAFVLS